MARYVICPRCELNFIDADEQEFCEVCIKELSGEKTFADGFDSEDGIEETELCPICGENYMALGEKMCEECKKKSAYEADVDDNEDEDKEDASWRSYLDDDEDELDLGIPDSEFDDEEEEEEEEEEHTEEEDVEYVSADDYYDFDDDDDDEDDDDEDDIFDDDDAPTPKTTKKRKKNDDF